ncbi:Bifunctional solanapyrone synthase [Madurella mycetomatis]|uniref:Bifunctional solanapyrone synthase n=1 Tax=Madurella mycetomatis TaxID=100816 RepID=A0A175VPX3_9PEZI|nr:Bifunctional solanapyrone synthase [Madurella mycetomatis]
MKPMAQLVEKSPLIQNTNPATAAVEACLAAQEALGTDSVSLAPINQTIIDVNWSEACWKAPSCVIQPSSAQILSVVLQIIWQFQVLFAVRSGGHSPNPGWASIGQPGILVDLSRLDAVSINADASVVSVGPGQRWRNVAAALDPYNVTVVGGRLPTLGVGGLVLGGGFSYFSGQYGLAADNVRNYEVVLGNGTIVEANSQVNPDLFWALKGGGPNFGIVTRFDLATIPVHTVYAEVLVYATVETPSVLRALAAWQLSAGASDVRATVVAISSLSGTTVGFVFSEPVARRPDAFAAFADIPVLETALPPANLSAIQLMEVAAALVNDARQRHDYRSVTTQIDGDLYVDMFNFWAERAASVYDKTGANQTFVLQPITPNLIQQGIDNGGNALGLRPSNMSWWTTLVDWKDANDDDIVRGVSIATTEEWKKRSTMEFLYMNDCSRDQDPLTSYGAHNVAKLRAISKKYDPDQVFQRLQHDGFLLRKTNV